MKVGDVYVSGTDYWIKVYTIACEVPGIGWGYDKIIHNVKKDTTEVQKYGDRHKPVIRYDQVVEFLQNKNYLNEDGEQIKQYDKIALLLLIGA